MLEGMLVVAPRRVRPSHPTSASSSGCRPSSSQRLMPPPWGPLFVMPAARDYVQGPHTNSSEGLLGLTAVRQHCKSA